MRAGQVEMGDEAHVGLVDAHAEGDGGDERQPLLLQERVLVGVAHGAVHARRGRAARGCPPPFRKAAVSSTLRG